MDFDRLLVCFVGWLVFVWVCFFFVFTCVVSSDVFPSSPVCP